MDPAQLIAKLRQRLQTAQIPEDVKSKLVDVVNRLEILVKTSGFNPENDRELEYVNFVLDLPWEKLGMDILDLNHAKQVLEKNHHGLLPLKQRVLEYLSVMILDRQAKQPPKEPILFFVGLAGTGKTTIAFSIAEALGRPLIRIPFGGLGSALQLRGESRVKPEAEPGLIMRGLKRAGVRNPVMLLDELDRVASEARNDIMGVLVELLDPEQNSAFLDHYVGFPFDLSQVLFVATANNTANISTAVMDRLEVMEMPFYSDDEKVVIGKSYLLPQALKNSGINPKTVSIEDSCWASIVRPLGFDGGIRSLKRNVDTLVRRVAMQIVEGNPGPYVINETNVKKYMNI
jgi:ATP-dependent Lon protease